MTVGRLSRFGRAIGLSTRCRSSHPSASAETKIDCVQARVKLRSGYSELIQQRRANMFKTFALPVLATSQILRFCAVHAERKGLVILFQARVHNDLRLTRRM